METYNDFGGHLARPGGRRKDQSMRGARLLGVNTEFFRFTGGLCSGSGNDHDVFIPVVVEGLSRQGNCTLAFFV